MPYFKEKVAFDEVPGELLQVEFHPDDFVACCICCCFWNLCGICCQCWCGLCCMMQICWGWNDSKWTFTKDGEAIFERRNHLCPYLMEDYNEYDILPINPAFANSTVTDGYDGEYVMKISLKGLDGDVIDLNESQDEEDIDARMKVIDRINSFYANTNAELHQEEVEKKKTFEAPTPVEDIFKSESKPADTGEHDFEPVHVEPEEPKEVDNLGFDTID